MSSTTRTQVDLSRIHARTRWVLIGSVLPAGMGMAAGFSASSLAAKEITDNDALSTLAATMIAIGGAIAAVPLGRYMARHGRRPGLFRAWMVGGAGGLLAFLAIQNRIYPLLLVGVICIGVGQAANLAARYVAADLAEPANRGRDIGIVVWAGSIGSVLGPTVALGGSGRVAELMGLDELAGPYLMAVVVFAIASFVVHTWLRPDPLLLALRSGAAGTERTRPSLRESFARLARYPPAAVAVFAMAVGQAVMVGIMTVTPLHMDDGNHEVHVIGYVISLHVVGMFMFSPVVGWIVDRLPAAAMVAVAGVTLFIGAEMASRTDPTDSAGVFAGLFLVGLGWSIATLSGSALLTASFDVSERATVQGAADFTMVMAGAISGLLSGVIVEARDFGFLSHWAALGALSLIVAGLYPLVTRIGSGARAAAPN